jgi:hypothetical protein
MRETFRTPNARYLEVYHLKPNTSYEFRIWATNDVGPGEMCTITARTIEPVQEKGEAIDTTKSLKACLKLLSSFIA